MNYKLDEKSQGPVGSVRRQMRPCRFGLHQTARGVVCGFFLVLWLANLTIQAQSLVPGVFNTGVDDSGAVLANYSVDSHYTLIVSADPNFPGRDTVVVDDTTFPIATGDWLANSSLSKWIAPQGNQDIGPGGDAVGNYTYRTTFDLTGYDPNLVTLTGQWTCDSQGTDVRINGLSTGNSTPGTNSPTNTREFHPLLITSGFVPGTNTLDFLVTRVPWPGSSLLPTGLRAEFVVSNLPPPSLQISSAGSDVLVWWPTNHASGFALETSASLGVSQTWSAFTGPVVNIGDQRVGVAAMTKGSAFFRLRKP